MVKALLQKILSNDHRTLSQVITRIENEDPLPDGFFHELYPHANQALRLGITGPPGAGKSTLADQLIQRYLDDGQTVGVVTVDPSSPFTGGALLGDRVRMNQYAWDERVFIRSMGSHGHPGGLARKSQEVGDVLSASGKDVIIFETIGVGQAELDVAQAVDITMVVLVPESGDEIQMMKAGLIEIADLFVVNKADREGAGRLSQLLKNLIHTFAQPGQVEPPVFTTVASRGEGVADLFKGIQDYLEKLSQTGELDQKRLERHRHRILTLIQEQLLDSFWTSDKVKAFEKQTQSIDSIQDSPYKISATLLNSCEHV